LPCCSFATAAVIPSKVTAVATNANIDIRFLCWDFMPVALLLAERR
jgi:hypothetical protein